MLDGPISNLPPEVAQVLAFSIVSLSGTIAAKWPLMSIFSAFIETMRLESIEARLPASMRLACIRSLLPGVASVSFRGEDARELVTMLSISPSAPFIKFLEAAEHSSFDLNSAVSAEVISRFLGLEECRLYSGTVNVETAKAVLRLPRIREVDFHPAIYSNTDTRPYLDAIVESPAVLKYISLPLSHPGEHECLLHAAEVFARWEGRKTLRRLVLDEDAVGAVELQRLKDYNIAQCFPNLDLESEEIYYSPIQVQRSVATETPQIEDAARRGSVTIQFENTFRIDQKEIDSIAEIFAAAKSMALSTERIWPDDLLFTKFHGLTLLSIEAPPQQVPIIGICPETLTILRIRLTDFTNQRCHDAKLKVMPALSSLKLLESLSLDACSTEGVDKSDFLCMLAGLPKLQSLQFHVWDPRRADRLANTEEVIISHPELSYLNVHVVNLSFIYGSLPKFVHSSGSSGSAYRRGVTQLPHMSSFSYDDASVHAEVLAVAKHDLCDLRLVVEPPLGFLRNIASSLTSSIRKLTISYANITVEDISALLKQLTHLWSLELGGWYTLPEHVPKLPSLNFLKHPRLSKLFISAETRPNAVFPAINLTGIELPSLSDLTLNFRGIQVREARFDGFAYLESAHLDLSSDKGLNISITNCASLQRLTLVGSASPMKPLQEFVLENVPQLWALTMASHGIKSKQTFRLRAPKLYYVQVSAFSKSDSTTASILKDLINEWHKANPTGKFESYQNLWDL